MVFLQETLGKSADVESSLYSLFPGWTFTALDALGHSGGLAISFKQGRLKVLNSWGLSYALGLEILSPDFDLPFLVINVYGPCQGRVSFWNDFLSKELLKNKKLLLGGDLNFSLGVAEAWGPNAREDSLADFFLKSLQTHNLIDVNIIKAKPTWRNRRTGEERIAKRLDRFLINESLASYIPLFRQWVGEGGNSDHFPIFLEFSKTPPKPASPFKFNATWLQEDSFLQLFRNTWRHPGSSPPENKGAHFMKNLNRLKRATIEWAANRKRKSNANLARIDEALSALEDPDADAYISQEEKERILGLEKRRAKILLDKEEEWRLKSRAIWLKAGDENTKFFHNYAKGRKNANTIWKLKDADGKEHSSFEAVSNLGKSHFQSLFADPGGTSIAEIIRTAQAFPRFVEEEEAENLYREVSKEEIENVIKSMPKDKSPGPDGWTIELFTHFFEQIGDELTEVVEESRKKGEIYGPFNATFIALIPKREDPESFEDFRPISLCNAIYKIIAKVIAVRLKPILSACISKEQFGFLDDRQIHEAIGVAQETIHSIRQARKKGAVLKLDLSKAFDRISWTYLRLLLTHLGFKDWNWLVAKIEQRISHWSFKWLPRAGRLTLINSVLQAIPVFWAALTWIPKGVLHKIKQICSRFLWSGAKEASVLPWVAWDKITRPKEWGGWGIKQLVDFSQSLAAKSGWRIITAENLWTRVVKRKYIDPMPLEDWIRSPNKKGKNCSVIWKATSESFKIIEKGLAWQVGNGENLRIGRDPWVGCNDLFALSPGLLAHLNTKGIHRLSQIENMDLYSIWGQEWKSVEDLGIDLNWSIEWQSYTHELKRSNVRIKDHPDSLVWAHAETGLYSPKAGYNFLMKRKGWDPPGWWAKPLFKLKCPKKTRIFLWCALKRKIPTWEILQARFKQGPSRCPLCQDASESITHLLVECFFTRQVWVETKNLLNINSRWEGGDLIAAWEFWWYNYAEKNLRNLPPILCWGIWIARNRSIFNEKATPVEVIAIQSSAILASIPEPEGPSSPNHRKDILIKDGIPWAFFDGAAQNNSSGAGIIIHLSPSHSLKASVGLGMGTNNFAELSALKLLLCWLIHRQVLQVQIFGDSSNVVNWVNGKFRWRNYMLMPLLAEIQNLKSSFSILSLDHIYREKNDEADRFSKAGLHQAVGSWRIKEQFQDQIRETDMAPSI
eukprot:PITA_30442